MDGGVRQPGERVVILVTGATGKTGKSLASQLAQAGIAYRAASRHSAPAFDWEDRATWDATLDGVTAIYLVAPGTVSDPYARMIEFIEAAQRKNVRRFVFLSMVGLPAGGPAHGQVHQWLKDNASDWAVLAPSAFMQNFSEGPQLATIREEGTFYSNTGMGRVPFIHVDDIAAVALKALTAPAPLNTDLVITSEEALSYDRVAELISDACGRRITHTHVTTEEMAERLMKRGIAQQTAIFLAYGYQTIAGGYHEATTDVVREMTGRAPVSFQQFAAANADLWKWGR